MVSLVSRHRLALAALAAVLATPAVAQKRTIKIYGFGAKSGVVRIFGLNSETAMKAAAEQINKAGGVFGGAVALFLRWRPRGLLDEALVHRMTSPRRRAVAPPAELETAR